MAFFPLIVPLALSVITLDLRLTHYKGSPFTLVSPTRNISISVSGSTLVAGNTPIVHFEINKPISLSISCVSESSLYFSTTEHNAVVHSPTICTRATGLLVHEDSLYGCITNAYHASKLLVSSICGEPDAKTTMPPIGTLQPVYVAEPLEVNEGGSMPLQWKNVYVFPEHSRLNVSNRDIMFTVVEGPQHGELTLHGQPCSAFSYADLLGRNVVYRHDGSETTADSFEFQLEFHSKVIDFPWLETATYTLKIKINAVNDPPELTESSMGRVIKISAKGRRVLTSAQLLLSDPDDGPDKVRVQVVEARGVHLVVDDKMVNEFTQRQLIHGKVSLVDEGIFKKGTLRLVARDGDARSNTLTLSTVSTPIEVRMESNTGVRLLHHSAIAITSSNLSFVASIPDLPIFYSLVGLPEHGVLECSPDDGHFGVCSKFSQEQVERGLVRFRHTSNQNPTQDTFSFQVETGEFVSMVHNFRISFIPMNVKVFNREVFMLNGTEIGILKRNHLFAWTFPKNYPADKLIYHIEEPPKFGILSRRIGMKNRRIGVSSNFTQEDIDNGTIQYKLHFMQFSIVNDFFLFRVVAPSVSSESQRFEIVFVPGQSSIQLVNRTVVVEEGQLAAVTTDFLSLTTSDEKNFVYTVTIPPSQGSLLLKVNGGGKVTISSGLNFTSRQVADGKVFYSHHGSESRSDRAYLTAESTFRPGRRIPFWISFSIILVNDNAPRLAGSDVIEIVERGERILHPSLLNWVDDDTDASPLSFDFSQSIKDAAVLSTVSPYHPNTMFTMNDLRDGKVMLRHLGHKTNFTIPYTVTDGTHVVKGSIRVLSSDPFVRITSSTIEYCCLPGDTPTITISPSNLSVNTNLDVKPSDILYSTLGTGFYVKSKTAWKPTQRFTQQDINNGRVSYKVQGRDQEQVAVRVGDRTLMADIQIARRSLGSTLELRKNVAASVPVGGAVVIDNTHLEQGDGATLADRLWFYVLRQPQEGTLVLDNESGSSQVSSLRFSQKDVDLGRLQYIHGGLAAGRDTVELNITSPHVTKGPYTLYIDIYEHHVSLTTSTATVVVGGSVVISPSIINVTSSDRDDYVLKVTSPPVYGWLVKEAWNLANISSVQSFSGVDLRERRVIYVSDRTQSATSDQFRVIACISEKKCTAEQTVDVQLTRRNVQSPQLLRNEVLRVSGERALITNSHLDTEDSDTSTESVIFLISRPSNGIVVHIDQPSIPIYNFSQKDIDENIVAFIRNNNASSSGGFSFLLSDGVHQIGPEWFSVEGWASSPLLEANARLIATPSASTIIGIDVLRANLPNARPHEVLFSITKQPKHGKILVDGRQSDKFSQSDINRKLVWYSSVGMEQKDWTRKDSFGFVVSRNGSGRPVEEEFRFRISSTYAALSDDVDKLVSTSTLFLSKGGSSALNSTHIYLERLVTVLENEVLLLEVGKAPRFGSLEWLEGGRGVVSVIEFQRGITAVYRHNGEDSGDDSVMFYVYPVSETTRRSSRMRITVPIRIRPLRDPLVQIKSFAPSIAVMNSGTTPMTFDNFLATHPHVPPQSIVYEVIQKGSIGVSIRVDEQERNLFSQDEVNRGAVSIFHIPVVAAASSNDVVVFSVEGHTRALVVKIRPLDLALENHTVIEYPQGKTYVVLNRTHLGAFSNGDRSKITYKVVNGPENGTFYWVAGEKEAKQFTQADIDDGRVLYAQLNMHSYQDAFDFILENQERDVVRNRSEIRVKPMVDVQPVIVETGTVTPLTSSQLNASLLQGSTPRFLVTSILEHGIITLDPISNHSALFFTFPDIIRGRVFYMAFPSAREVTERIELEVRADSVQPARLILPITILPTDSETDERPSEPTNTTEASISEFPKLVPASYHLPIILIACILVVTICILTYLKRDKKKKKEPPPPATPPRIPPTPRESVSAEKQDLLGSTVFATVGSGLRPEPARPPMRTFERPQPPATPTSLAAKRRMQPSLDYAGLVGDAPPVMPLFKQVNSRAGEGQYWV